MAAYYNEIEPTAILWLRAAMDAGIIAPGEIDTRPIQEVKADDLRGFTQCHFFAGIGGWSIALRKAGWDDTRPVWTGSCPCQPFSSAGKQKGKDDERHLWPVWYSLVRECRPSIVFGEQVSSAIAHGWLDDVYQGLESEGYAIGSAVLPACGVGKAHKRDRLWFVAESEGERDSRASRTGGEAFGRPATRDSNEPWGTSTERGTMGNAEYNGQFAAAQSGSQGQTIQHHAEGAHGSSQPAGAGNPHHVAYRFQPRLEGHTRYDCAAQRRQEPHGSITESDSFEWILCPDGKARPIKPGLRLLVDGLPGRLRKAALHGYGNAIVPQVAAEFIGAYMETLTALCGEYGRTE